MYVSWFDFLSGFAYGQVRENYKNTEKLENKPIRIDVSNWLDNAIIVSVTCLARVKEKCTFLKIQNPFSQEPNNGLTWTSNGKFSRLECMWSENVRLIFSVGSFPVNKCLQSWNLRFTYTSLHTENNEWINK